MKEDTEALGQRVAIIGMAGRFPGADDIDGFWQNLVDGVESLTEVSDEQLRAAGVPESSIADPHYVKRLPLLDDIAGFDAKHFGHSTREAQIADPQQRIFLEICHTALQHAGQDPARFSGDIGVFGGGAPNTYSEGVVYKNGEVFRAVGGFTIEINNAADYLATRTAFALGLTGPSLTVQSACSTALVAVHLARRSLAAGECSMAVAGGVNIRVPQHKGHLWAAGGVYSRDGRIRAFDAAASGTNFGHGGGVVVLKRYQDAVADGDTVHAVILGSAINNDGAARTSFSAPSATGQTEVVSRALAAAGISPDTIGYVEAHGTGTEVGDPIEVAALAAAYRGAGATVRRGIPIGSVKPNIGHLGAAAGAAGLIKTVLAIKHRHLPATLHFEKPNPGIDFAQTPFHVPKNARQWPRTEGPLRAGVSSFGIGGTNAHVIVEEAPEAKPTGSSRTWQVLPLSATTASALAAMRRQLADHLTAHPEQPLADVAFTLQLGRPDLAHRAVAVCRDAETALTALTSAEGTGLASRHTTPVAFLFPGQGSQHMDMARELYDSEPVFRDAFDACAQLADPHLGSDLRDAVFSTDGEDAEAAAERLRQTDVTQPALFAIEYALAELWLSWGVEPAAMIGHSVGEFVAACLAGVFTLSAAVELVATRGRLIQSMPTGSMLALPLAEADVETLLTEDIGLAAVNSGQSTVLSGPTEAIEDLMAGLAGTGVQGTLLRTSHAFHSAMLDPVVEPMREAVERAAPKPPARRFLSTVTGDWITDEQATDPHYWAGQLRAPVRFASAVAKATELGATLLEVGPGRALGSLARQGAGKAAVTVASLAKPGSGDSDGQAMARAAGAVWASGAALDWARLHAGARRRKVPLPTYPYERTQHWIDPDPAGASTDAGRTTLSDPSVASVESDASTGAPAGADPITFVPVWKQQRLTPRSPATSGTGPWLVFIPGDNGLVDEAADELSRRGESVVRVSAGDGFADLGHGHFRIRPGAHDDYKELLKAVESAVGRPANVLHGWTTALPATEGKDSRADGPGDGRADVAAVREQGFYSLLHLSQAWSTRWPDADLGIRIATRHSADVSGADPVDPATALLLGPCYVLPIESGTLDCQLIDLSAGTAVDQLLAELVTPIDGVRRVAYRRGRRWVADHEPAALPEPTTLPRTLRRRGVYLVTGGLGVLGLRLAHELVRTVGARLVLTARTPLPPRAEWDAHLDADGEARTSTVIRQVRELEELGTEVLVAAADVADEEAMREVVTAAHERFGRIDGIFHMAGIAGGGLASMKRPEQADAVLAPKVDGTLVLDRLLGEEIDLFVMFSSIFAVTGGYGQVDYVAANAFMDAFALSRAGGRAHHVSVNWCGWEGSGMLAGQLTAPADAAATAGAGTSDAAATGGVRLGEKGPGLLGGRVLGTDGTDGPGDIVFIATTGPEAHWVLIEHRIGGQPVFPGTSYLEMITSACREAVGPGPVEIRDLMFGRPLAIDGPREMRVAGVPRASGGYQFTITSRALDRPGATWERHASASAGAYHGEPAGPRHDIDAVAERCDRLAWTPDLGMTDAGVEFGPHWQVVQEVRLGDREQLARLALADGLSNDLAEYRLHPSLLDAATALSLYMPDAGRDGKSFLPIAYDQVIVRDRIPQRFYSHVRGSGTADGPGPSGISTYDVSLLDEDGRELVDIRGFSVRTVDVESVRAGLTAPDDGAGGEKPVSPSFGLADEELFLDQTLGLDLLWRMLNSRAEPQYVVTRESIADKSARLTGIAARVLSAIESAGSGRRADSAPPAARTQVPGSAPATATEVALLPLWADAFALTELGPDEDFFDLGGNSLVAVQLSVRIREHFGINVPGVTVLEYPTVRALAGYVDAALAGVGT